MCTDMSLPKRRAATVHNHRPADATKTNKANSKERQDERPRRSPDGSATARFNARTQVSRPSTSPTTRCPTWTNCSTQRPGPTYSKAHTRAWAEAIDSFDGYVFITPECNHSTTGVLKTRSTTSTSNGTTKPPGSCPRDSPAAPAPLSTSA